MKLINLDTQLKQIDETPVSRDNKPFTIGWALSDMVLTTETKSFDKLKTYELGKKLFNCEDIDLDSSDSKKLKEIVEHDKGFSPIVAGQIIEYLDTL